MRDLFTGLFKTAWDRLSPATRTSLGIAIIFSLWTGAVVLGTTEFNKKFSPYQEGPLTREQIAQDMGDMADVWLTIRRQGDSIRSIAEDVDTLTVRLTSHINDFGTWTTALGYQVTSLEKAVRDTGCLVEAQLGLREPITCLPEKSTNAAEGAD